MFPKFSALDLDSESALDSVISALLRFCIFPFLKVAFSRIFSRFCVLFCFFAKRGVIPSPHSQSPEKDKAPRFCCALLASLRHGNRGECLAVSASSAIVAEAVAPPFLNDCTPRSGREVVGAIAPTYLLDFCSAKMAESKFLDSA